MNIKIESLNRGLVNMYVGEEIVNQTITDTACKCTIEINKDITTEGTITFETEMPDSFKDAENRIRALFKEGSK